MHFVVFWRKLLLHWEVNSNEPVIILQKYAGKKENANNREKITGNLFKNGGLLMNPEHYELAKKSIKEFNDWRAQNYDVKPDLSGADLRGLNLFKINFANANLAGADLRGATLISVEARNADLEHADLGGALLQNANFSMANMTRVNLKGANLTGAFMQDCSFVEADLSETDCTCTKFRNSNFTDATFYDCIVKGASFEGSNIDQANIFYEQFKDANIPLELMGTMEKKTKPKHHIIYAFISLAFAFIFLFVFFQWVFTANEPGTLNARIKAGIYKQYGNFLILTGMNEEGVKNLVISIKLKPDTAKDKAEIYSTLAANFRELNEEDKAAYCYKRMLELDPGNSKAVPAEDFLLKHKEKGRKPAEI